MESLLAFFSAWGRPAAPMYHWSKRVSEEPSNMASIQRLLSKSKSLSLTAAREDVAGPREPVMVARDSGVTHRSYIHMYCILRTDKYGDVDQQRARSASNYRADPRSGSFKRGALCKVVQLGLLDSDSIDDPLRYRCYMLLLPDAGIPFP